MFQTTTSNSNDIIDRLCSFILALLDFSRNFGKMTKYLFQIYKQKYRRLRIVLTYSQIGPQLLQKQNRPQMLRLRIEEFMTEFEIIIIFVT